ncbi:hypothetical protein CEXT_793451 [Caerostris extrusa]|uniref:Uncharacterized protein n=1 Tax=Caerostris extrusa TaxID=172846 RepID=A0AAV4SWY0_CAEEX|nr:hypothetical protein CEXT_793451 [Caerostris extrusa]
MSMSTLLTPHYHCPVILELSINCPINNRPIAQGVFYECRSCWKNQPPIGYSRRTTLANGDRTPTRSGPTLVTYGAWR